MKCPECGPVEDQAHLGPTDTNSIGYRCGKCGRLYVVPLIDLERLIDHLQQLWSEADSMGRHQVEFAQRIAEVERQLKAAHDGH